MTLVVTIEYSLSSGRTSTTYTTVSRTTLPVGGSTYVTTTGQYSGCIPPVQCYFTTVTTEIYLSTSPNTTSTTSESPQSSTISATTAIVGSQTYITFNKTLGCCNNSTVGATFDYPVSITYNGSWNLRYWLENPDYIILKNSVEGNATGSGNSETWITFYVDGYEGYTLCANATKLDYSQNNLTLTLSVLGQNQSTIASNPTAEVCATMAV